MLATIALTATLFMQHPGPVLTPTQPWEDQAVAEPTVLYEKGVYRMWYTGGYSGHNALGYATSRDGITWSKYAGNPVLGEGGSGLPGNAAHFSVMRHGKILYAFFNADDTSYGRNDDLYVATSTDGKHWVPYAEPVLGNADWHNDNCNTFVWADGKGWHMLVESMNRQTGFWMTGLANGATPFHFTAEATPLMSLQLSGTGMFGGPWLERTANGWKIYYHASTTGQNFPTDVYEADSTDLHTWTPNVIPLVRREQPWEYDQVADPSLANGLLFFDGLDNTDLVRFKSSIGVATLG